MIIGNRYKIKEQIGEGAFGQIHKGENIRTGELVAIKMELLTSETKLLKNESRVYQYLDKIRGIPQLKWFGVDEHHNYMVFTLLGDSLTVFKNKYPVLSLKIVMKIGYQMVKLLESIHAKYLLHRDVKPDNFLFGIENKAELYLIDFGFCKKFIDNSGKHIQCSSNKTPLGTPNFFSINVHDGVEPSRRDDLESVVYILLFLFQKSLEWKDSCEYYTEYKNMNSKIKQLKLKTMETEEIPLQLREIWKHCRSLRFEEKPNYELIYEIMKKN